VRTPTVWPLRRSRLGHLMSPCELGISARSAAVSAVLMLPSSDYTVIGGGGSEEVEATAQAVALLFACGAPAIVAVAAGASYRFVRRSRQSVDEYRLWQSR
jgi:hypothetical protein